MRGKPLDLTGKRYGKLTAMKLTDERCGTNYVWLCRCDCGNIAYISTKSWGKTRSCGCLIGRRTRR